ncbi:MAG TPA: MtrB/PioB family outer membrane beta-barrel protein [Burkholderiales bacterium]|nr:MtrB/PioB family outer membrane beta-barrel protein [Burkholderiales bacterium]
MKRPLLAVPLTAMAIAVPHAMAQELSTSGYVSGNGIVSDVNSRNPFRFSEYRDLRTGPSLGADLRGESGTHYLGFFGENLGRDDQFAEFKGGKYGAYKYSIYSNDIVHNLTYNAITPYTSGVGTNNLSFAGGAATTNTANWSTFDYGIQHKNVGGTFELQSSQNSPYYFRATANQKETRGMRPLGFTMNAQGGPMVELPAPVDYTTTDASGEIGYATKTSHFSINLAYSQFQDHNDTLTWRLPNQAANITDQSTLAADNKLWKLGMNAVWKQLPMGSTVALRGTYSTLSNDLPVRTTWRSNAALSTAIASTPLFSGDVLHETFSASWTAQPSRELDTRVYYNYDRKKNESTQVVFTGAGACDVNPFTGVAGTTCTSEAFHYRKNNVGGELGYRMNSENKLSGGWDYVDTNRNRTDYDNTKDNKVYVEWKNSSLDLLSSRIKYQRLQRRSNFLLAGINPNANVNNFFNFYVRRYDLVDDDQDLFKIVLDSSPAPFVDLGAELIYKENRYKNVVFGRTGDKRDELYLTAGFGDPKAFRITAFFDYERTNYDSQHWQGNPNASLAPAGGPPSTSFLWSSQVADKNYLVGLAADWPYQDRWKFKSSLIWQETDGTADFASNAVNFPLFNIPAYDSFNKIAFNFSGIYQINKNFELTAGYAYERYHYNDAQLNGYNYTQGGNYLSGAYAFPQYNANIFYLTLKYRLN